MSEGAIIDLILKAGAIAVLVWGGFLILKGDLVTKGSVAAIRAADAEKFAEVRAADAKTLAEVTRDRDEWKAIAKESVGTSAAAVGDVKDLAEALTVRNRIDEDLRRAGVLAKGGTA